MAKENFYGVAHIIEEHAPVAKIVAHGGICGGVTFCSEHAVNYFVIGHVGFDGVLKPNMPTQAAVLFTGFEAKEIAPEVEEARIEARRLDKGVDKLGAFVVRLGL